MIKAVGEEEIIMIGWLCPVVFVREIHYVQGRNLRAFRASSFGSVAGVEGVGAAPARLDSFSFFNFSTYAARTAEKF